MQYNESFRTYTYICLPIRSKTDIDSFVFLDETRESRVVAGLAAKAARTLRLVEKPLLLLPVAAAHPARAWEWSPCAQRLVHELARDRMWICEGPPLDGHVHTQNTLREKASARSARDFRLRGSFYNAHFEHSPNSLLLSFRNFFFKITESCSTKNCK